MLQEIGRKSEEIGGNRGNREIGEIGENQQCCTVNTQGWFFGGEWNVESAQGSPAVVLEWTVENAQDACGGFHDHEIRVVCQSKPSLLTCCVLRAMRIENAAIVSCAHMFCCTCLANYVKL